jgi:hypothetical protein
LYGLREVHPPNFDRFSKIVQKTLWKHVEAIIYDGNEIARRENPGFQGWLRYKAAQRIGIQDNKREEVLA